MIDRNQYVVQPYRVGPKERKSLVITIPSTVSKKYKIDFNTILVFRPVDENTIELYIIEDSSKNSSEQSRIR